MGQCLQNSFSRAKILHESGLSESAPKKTHSGVGREGERGPSLMRKSFEGNFGSVFKDQRGEGAGAVYSQRPSVSGPELTLEGPSGSLYTRPSSFCPSDRGLGGWPWRAGFPSPPALGKHPACLAEVLVSARPLCNLMFAGLFQ